jgi:hypothetical protein
MSSTNYRPACGRKEVQVKYYTRILFFLAGLAFVGAGLVATEVVHADSAYSVSAACQPADGDTYTHLSGGVWINAAVIKQMIVCPLQPSTMTEAHGSLKIVWNDQNNDSGSAGELDWYWYTYDSYVTYATSDGGYCDLDDGERGTVTCADPWPTAADGAEWGWIEFDIPGSDSGYQSRILAYGF